MEMTIETHNLPFDLRFLGSSFFVIVMPVNAAECDSIEEIRARCAEAIQFKRG